MKRKAFTLGELLATITLILSVGVILLGILVVAILKIGKTYGWF